MHEVRVELDVAARMRDGTTLRANVYRPAEGRHPVLLTRLPYGKDFPIGSSALDPVQAARRGYVVIVQDTRGRWASEGEWATFRHERSDGLDTVDWAAALPYADGQVGMYGASYFAFTQWAAALERPKALRAIAPIFTWSEPLDGLAFRGGALELGLAYWRMQFGLNEVSRRHAQDPARAAAAIAQLVGDMDHLAGEGYRSLPLRDFAPLARHGLLRDLADAFEGPHERDRWEHARVAGHHERIDVPSFNIGGWYDAFLGGTLQNFSAMRRRRIPTKLLVGPWSHAEQGSRVGEITFGFAAQAGFIDLRADLGSLQLRWFERWLKGAPNGVDEEPPVTIFVMGTNVWRHEAEWPLARAVETAYFLRAGGALSTGAPAGEEPDRYVYDPADPAPTVGGATLMSPEFPSGPRDQRPLEARADVLVYSSAPLERDLEVTGPVRVHLFAASTAADTDFVARLVDVHPDGYARNLTDGILRARYRDPEHPAPIEPGRPYEFVIDLWATSNVFRKGHRIRLDVTSSSFPRWDRNPNTGHPFAADAELAVAHQVIFHDARRPSRVVLPLVSS